MQCSEAAASAHIPVIMSRGYVGETADHNVVKRRVEEGLLLWVVVVPSVDYLIPTYYCQRT